MQMQNCTQTKQLCSKKVGWLVNSGKQKFQKDKQREKVKMNGNALCICCMYTTNKQYSDSHTKRVLIK